MQRPQLSHLEPRWSDVTDRPDTVRVFGLGLGPGTTGEIYCIWNDQPPVAGEYLDSAQRSGDRWSEIMCDPPQSDHQSGDIVHLRVSITEPSEDLLSAAPGVPLVFFDRRRKPQLLGHAEGSALYGSVAGGSMLLLLGSNFAPLGDGIQCVFTSDSSDASSDSVPATFVSNTQLACLSPSHSRGGDVEVHVQTMFGSSLDTSGGELAQTVAFVYYLPEEPPSVSTLVPAHAPIDGRPLVFDADGHWNRYATPPSGGILLLGSNFVPSDYLWCAFGVPPERKTSRGAWHWTRAVYVNTSAVRCEVPPGVVGIFTVAASTDDVTYSTQIAQLTYYDPRRKAELLPFQKVSVPVANSAPSVTLRGANFAPFAPPALLCRYGEEVTLRDGAIIITNSSEGDLVELYENVFHASFVSQDESIRCSSPVRALGAELKVFVSTGGLSAFSDDAALLTYYDDSEPISFGGPTFASELVPSFGPVHESTAVVVSGTNFAFTSALNCALTFRSGNSAAADDSASAWLVPATLVNFSLALCEVRANEAGKYGNARLGLTLRGQPGGNAGPAFIFFDPLLETSVSAKLAYGLANESSQVELTGENFAPTPTLRCELRRSTTRGGTLVAAEGVPDLVTAATCISSTNMLCELPPQPVGRMYQLHVNLRPELPPGENAPVPRSAAVVVFYEPALPVVVHSLVAEATGAPYASIDANNVFIVRVTNVAPTESRLRCLLTPESGDGDDDNEPPLMDATLDGSMAVAAEYVDATTVKCEALNTLAAGDYRLHLTHSSEGRWSDTFARFALYRASAPAELSSVVPAYADLAKPTMLKVNGTNFAPTAELSCVFKRAGEEKARTPARFITSDRISCEAPGRGDDGAATVGENVTLHVSHAADEAAVSAVGLTLRYVDSDVPPRVLSLSPVYGSYRAGTPLIVQAWNVGPILGGALRCRFGSAPHTRAAWRGYESATGIAAVACIAPPGRYQEPSLLMSLQAAQPTAEGADDSAALLELDERAAGTVDLHLSIDGGLTMSEPDEDDQGAATFTYYDPLTPPSIVSARTLEELAHLAASELVSEVTGGALLELAAANLAPTNALACRFDLAEHASAGLRAGPLSPGAIPSPSTMAATLVAPSRLRCLSPSLSGFDGAGTGAQVAVRIANVYIGAEPSASHWSAPVPLLFYNLSAHSPVIAPTPRHAATGSRGGVVTLEGQNFAPLAQLGCWWGGNQSWTRTAARYVDSTHVECYIPLWPADGTGDFLLEVRLHDGAPSPPPSAAATFTFYDEAVPPLALSVHPDYTDSESGGMLQVNGANFAPTAGLRCVFEGDGSVKLTSAATFVSASMVRCEVPSCADAASCAYARGTLQLFVTHGMLQAGAGLTFTFYRHAEPPSILGVVPVAIAGAPPTSDIRGSLEYLLKGSNFAPTGASLRCRFTANNVPFEVVARFVDAGTVACATPGITDDGYTLEQLEPLVGDATLELSHSAAEGLWSVARSFIFYDGARAPEVDFTVPRALRSGGDGDGGDGGVGGDGTRERVFVHGANFAPTGAMRCRFGALSVAVASYTSATQLVCEAPAAVAPGSELVLSVLHSESSLAPEGSSPISLVFYARAEPPSVYEVTPAYGSVHGSATEVIVDGANFAPTGSLLCRYGSSLEGYHETPGRFISPTSIACAVPAFAPGPIDTLLGASNDGGANFSSGGARFTFYDDTALPTLSSFAPQFGPHLGGTVLTVSGANFAPLSGLSCDFDGERGSATFESARRLRCSAPPLPPSGVSVSVSLGGSSSAASATRFVYYNVTQSPVLSALTPSWGPVVGGQVLTVHGANFAPTGEARCHWALGAALGEHSAAAFVSHDEVHCVTPSAAAGEARLGVSNAVEEGDPILEDMLLFDVYDPMQPLDVRDVAPRSCGSAQLDSAGGQAQGAADTCAIELLTANVVPTPGLSCLFSSASDSALVSGTYVSGTRARCHAPTSLPPGDYLLQLSLYANGQPAPSNPSAPGPPPAPQLPDGDSTGLGAEWHQDFLESAHLDSPWPSRGGRLVLYDSTSPPQTSGVSPVMVHPDGGTMLQVLGTNLDRNLACSFASSAGSALVDAVFVSTGEVNCQTPAAADFSANPDLGAFELSLRRASGDSTSSPPLALTFSVPVVSSVTPLVGPSVGASRLVLRGTALLGVSHCQFGGAASVMPALKVNESSLECVSPPHEAGVVELNLTIDGLHWFSAGRFSFYAHPRPNGLSPRSGTPGTLLRLRGSNLAYDWPAADPLQSQDALNASVIRFSDVEGGGAEVLLPAIAATPALLKYVAPPRAAGAVRLALTLNGQQWHSVLDDETRAPIDFVHLELPVLSSITPSAGPIGGGTAITLFGAGFAPVALRDRGLLRAICRFGANPFLPDRPTDHVVAANVTGSVAEGRAVCTSPSTLLPGLTGGMVGVVDVSLSLDGGDEAASLPEERNFASGAPALRFRFYSFEVTRLSPSAVPEAGGTLLELAGEGLLNASADAAPRCRFGAGGSDVPASPAANGNDALMCTVPAGTGSVPVLLAPNGIDFERVGELSYFEPPVLDSLEPPGGPVRGGTVVSVRGQRLDDEDVSNRTFHVHGSAEAAGFVVDGVGHADLSLSRGQPCRFQVEAPGVPFALTTSAVGGGAAVRALITTGVVAVNGSQQPLEQGVLSFVADASLPTTIYFQSTEHAWHADPSDARAFQQITLKPPEGASRARFGALEVLQLSRNESVLQLLSPPYAGAGAATVELSRNGLSEHYVGALDFSYHEEPTLLRLSPSGGPTRGGTTVTLVGDGFAPAPDDIFTLERMRFFFDGGDAQNASGRNETLATAVNVTARNETHATCETPPSREPQPPYLNHGAPKFGLVARTTGLRLALNGRDGSDASIGFTYYDEPILSALVPARGPIAGATDVLLRGAGFEAFAGDLDDSERPTCRFGMKRVLAQVLNDTALICKSPLDAVELSPSDGASEAPTAAVVVQLALNGLQFAPVLDELAVDAAAAPSGALHFVYYAQPRIEAIDPIGGSPRGGTLVTLFGSGLGVPTGANASSATTPRIIFGNTSEAVLIEWSHSRIVCTQPPFPEMEVDDADAPRSLALAISLNGQQFERVDVNYTLASATVSVLTPPAGPARGGTLVHINGSNLDTLFVPNVSVCLFGARRTPILHVSEGGALAACEAPSSAPGEVEFALSLNGAEKLLAPLAPLRYAYYADPLVISAVPHGGPTRGGTQVTLRGYGLVGGFAGGAYDAPRCKWCVATALDATGSRCLGGADALGRPISSDEYTSLTPLSPEASLADPNATASELSRTTMCGASPGLLPDTPSTPPPAPPASYTKAPVESAVCDSPGGNGSVPLELALNGVDGSAVELRFVYYEQPTLLTLEPRAGPAAGGTVVTVHGEGFDAFGSAESPATSALVARCRFGSHESQVLEMSPERVLCIAPANADAAVEGSWVDVSLSLNGAPGDFGDTAVPFFYYRAPPMTLTPSAGPVAGGTRVLLRGQGLFLNLSHPNRSSLYEEALIDGARDSGSVMGGDAAEISQRSETICRFGSTLVTGSVLAGPQPGLASVACYAPAAVQGAERVVLALTLNGRDFEDALSEGGGEPEVGSEPAPLTFSYYEPPRLLSLVPTAGPVLGGTMVALHFELHTPFDEMRRALLSVSACRFGAHTSLGGGATRIGNGIAGAAPDGDHGRWSLLCISPPHGASVAEVRIVLNGQQAAPAASSVSTLTSVAVEAFRFYEPPSLSALSPQGGPTAGGTRLRLHGVGFRANAPAGDGDSGARCRIGSQLVSATLISDQEVECETPAASVGAARVSLSLNGGADWHHKDAASNLSHASLQWYGGALSSSAEVADGLFFRYECEPYPEGGFSSCVLDEGCAWCAAADAGVERCLPCAELPNGVRNCAFGPRPPLRCEQMAWEFVTPLSWEGDSFAAPIVSEGALDAGHARYFGFSTKHRHGVLRVQAHGSDGGIFLSATRHRPGLASGSPLNTADGAAWEYESRLDSVTPLELPQHLLPCSLRSASRPLECERWLLRLEGRGFHEKAVANPSPLFAEGAAADSTPPLHAGNFYVPDTRRSHFSLRISWEPSFDDFDFSSCDGGDSVGCGLRLLGSAAPLKVDATLNATHGPLVVSLVRPRAFVAGAMWLDTPLHLAAGFESRFDFRFTEQSLCSTGAGSTVSPCEGARPVGDSGLSFVVHSAADSAGALGCAGDGYGIAARGECNDCISPALAVRFETHANVSLAENGEGLLRWTYANRVRVLRMTAAQCDEDPIPEELVAVVLDPAHFGIRLGDGTMHHGYVHYLPPLLSVEVNGKLVLQLPLELSSENNTVLAPDGRATVGFVSANSRVGHEAVHIHSWRVRQFQL